MTAGVTLCLAARLCAWGPTEWPTDGSCTQALNLLGEFRASGTGGKTGKAQLKLKSHGTVVRNQQLFSGPQLQSKDNF